MAKQSSRPCTPNTGESSLNEAVTSSEKQETASHMKEQLNEEDIEKIRKSLLIPSFRQIVTTVTLTLVVAWLTPKLFDHKLPVFIRGTVAPGFEPVLHAFGQNFRSGQESQGAAFVAFYRGRQVVNVWGGYADAESERTWRQDTMSNWFSVTKSACALVVAMLRDRGLLRYEDLVAKHWPEFAQAGKGNITVSMLMAHQAGLAALDQRVNITHLQQGSLAGILARQAPMWPAGSRHGYHTFTFGWYVDQLVRRVDPAGRSVARFFADEVAQPLGGLDWHLALPRGLDHRCARLQDYTGLRGLLHDLWWQNSRRLLFNMLLHPQGLAARSILRTTGVKNVHYNNPEYRQVENPSVNGFGTALAVAKVFRALAHGGTCPETGVRLVSRDTLAEMTRLVASDYDLVLLFQENMAHGVKLVRSPAGGWAFGHQGYGSQAAFADPELQLSWAYLSNGLAEEPRGEHPRYVALRDALYASARAAEGSL